MVIGKGYITIAVIHDGVDGANGYTVTATPSVITLGITKVSDTAFAADTTKNNTSAIKVFKGNVDVTKTCRVTVLSAVNCAARQSSENASEIKVIRMSTYTADGVTYPFTTGSVTVAINTGGTTLSHTVAVNVDMSVVWGGVETTVRGLKSEFGELQQDLQSEAPNVLTKYTSTIEQTAKRISAKVAKETVGRLNVLPGTAFNRETDVEQLSSRFRCKFEPLGGLDGTGAAVVSQSGATSPTWCGVSWRGVELKPSTYYTASVWARADGGLDDNMYMSFSQKGASAQISYTLLAKANETFGWKLFTTTFKTGKTKADCDNVQVELGIRTNGMGRFCKMMLDESGSYNGWTPASYADVSSGALLAAGIEITSDMVELYGNQVKVSGAKGGTPVAMFENGMLNSNLINADKIMASQLQTTGSNGQSVSIENGLMRVYGTNGRCNIEFGVNSNGEAILSYYDKDGKWLYDLGPNKLDGEQLKESTLNGEKYVSALSFFETNDFFTLETYINFIVKQVRREYSQRLFGNNLFVPDDQEIAKNNAAHLGYKPFERVSSSDVTILYRYTAPRQSGTIIKDETYGLTTAALAKQANGKYFTSNSKLAVNGQLTNLAPAGYYFRQSEQVMMAPSPKPSAGTQSAQFPAYSIRCLKITDDSTGTLMKGFNSMMSYLMRTIKIEI